MSVNEIDKAALRIHDIDNVNNNNEWMTHLKLNMKLQL